eukprot:GHVQ01021609.1.p1 GENE.GHVQ01021609.1~~GHVQ01021609.1.p1  ORF type:complete len:1004 (+),score=114.76 GHVQ01021609.1:63-3074(+)
MPRYLGDMFSVSQPLTTLSSNLYGSASAFSSVMLPSMTRFPSDVVYYIDGLFVAFDTLVPDSLVGTKSAPPVPIGGQYGNVTSWILWWNEQLRLNCQYTPGALQISDSPAHYKDFMQPYSKTAANFFDAAGASRDNSLTLWLGDEITFYQYVTDYTGPFVLGLVLPGFVLLLLLCFSCLCLSSSCRRVGAKLTCNQLFSDRERVSLHRMSMWRRVVSGGGLLCVGVLAVIVAVAVALRFTVIAGDGVSSAQCSLWRGSYEIVYGDTFTGSSEYRDDYLKWIEMANPRYSNGTTYGWMGVAALLEWTQYFAETTNPRGGSMQRLAYQQNARMQLQVFPVSQELSASLRRVSNTLDPVLPIVSPRFHVCIYCGYSSSASAMATQVSTGTVDQMKALNKQILTFLGPDSESLNDAYATARDFDNTFRDISNSIMKFMELAVLIQSEVNSVQYIAKAGLVLFSLCALLATVALTCALTCTCVSMQRQRSPVQSSISVATCSWIVFGCYGALALMLSGVCLAILGFVSEGCGVVQLDIMTDGAIGNYSRLVSLDPRLNDIVNECMVIGGHGEFLKAMNATEPIANMKTQVIDARDGFADSVRQITEEVDMSEISVIDRNCTELSWAYFPDLNAAAQAGHNSAAPLPEAIIFSGLQPFDIPRVNNSLWPESVPVLYGLQSVVLTIRETGESATTKGWCMEHQPEDVLGACDALSTQAGGVAITRSTQADPTNRDPVLQVAFDEILAAAGQLKAEEFINSVWWAAQKEHILSASFPCPDGSLGCMFSEYSPYVVPGNTSDSTICELTNRCATEASAFEGIVTAEANMMSVVIGYQFDVMAGSISKLQDGTGCDLWWKNLELVMQTFCQNTAAPFAFVALVWCILAGLCLVSMVLTFKLWHYLFDINRSIKRIQHIAQLRGIVAQPASSASTPSTDTPVPAFARAASQLPAHTMNSALDEISDSPRGLTRTNSLPYVNVDEEKEERKEEGEEEEESGGEGRGGAGQLKGSG